MRSSILARIPGFRQRIIPEPRIPSRGSQAQGTRLITSQSRTQSMPVRRLGAGHAQHLTCERAYSGYEIDYVGDHPQSQGLTADTALPCCLRQRSVSCEALGPRMVGDLLIISENHNPCSPSLRSSGRNARLWNNPLLEARNLKESWLRLKYAFHFNGQSDSSLKRIIPEPRVPSRGSQARGTRL